MITSANKKVKWAETIVMRISTSSLFCIFHSIFEKATQEIVQKIIPHNNIDMNDNIQEKIIWFFITHHVAIIPRITRNSATEVPSLKRLSHSNIRASLFGAHTDLNIDNTATGSVALIREAKSKHTRKGIKNPVIEKIKYSRVEMTRVEMRSHITARLEIVFQFFRSSLYFILYDDSKSKIGKNT